jgi:hypothetical protein
MKIISLEEHTEDAYIARASQPAQTSEAGYVADWGSRVEDKPTAFTVNRPHLVSPKGAVDYPHKLLLLRGSPEPSRRILGIGLRLLPFDRPKSQPDFMKKTTTPKTTAPILHVNENVSLEEQIAQRAHELWHQRRCRHGGDIDDWLQAEREINEWHQRRLTKKL